MNVFIKMLQDEALLQQDSTWVTQLPAARAQKEDEKKVRSIFLL